MTSLKFFFFLTLGLILLFSAVSMAKPWFYLHSLDMPHQFVVELGPPFAQRVSDQNQLQYLYRGGLVKPFCIDYELTFTQGKLSTWTWHVCTKVPAFSDDFFIPTLGGELSWSGTPHDASARRTSKHLS